MAKKYVSIIEDSLKDYFFIKSNSALYNKNGLITGLKTKNVSFEIGFFPVIKTHNLLKKVVGKGYHLVKLSDNLFFINTHLYDPINKTEEIITESQFNTLEKLIGTKNTILAGDLNITKEKLMKLSKKMVYDTPFYTGDSKINYLTKKRLNRFSYTDFVSEYILKTKKSNISISIQRMRTPIVSDHFILLADAKIE